MKQLTNKMMNFGKLVASGTPPVDAYEQAYGCTRRVAGRNAARCMRLPALRQFLDELLEKTREEALPLREEVRDFLTRTMSDEDSPYPLPLPRVEQRIPPASRAGGIRCSTRGSGSGYGVPGNYRGGSGARGDCARISGQKLQQVAEKDSRLRRFTSCLHGGTR